MSFISKAVTQINKDFGEPFLPKGFVHASTNDDGDFLLRIGSRDIIIKSDGSSVGAGTELSIKWSISSEKGKPWVEDPSE